MVKIDLDLKVVDEGGSSMYNLTEAHIWDVDEILIKTDDDFELSLEDCENLYGWNYREDVETIISNTIEELYNLWFEKRDNN